MSATGTNSVTSVNFIGFEEGAKNSINPLLFNRIYIAPTLPVTAGKWIHASAGFLPGQQSYLKRRSTVWNKSRIADDLKRAGFARVTY